VALKQKEVGKKLTIGDRLIVHALFPFKETLVNCGPETEGGWKKAYNW